MFVTRQIDYLLKELQATHDVAMKEYPLWDWGQTKKDIEDYFIEIPSEERKQWPEEFRSVLKIDLGKSSNFSRFVKNPGKKPDMLKIIAIYYWLKTEKNSWSGYDESVFHNHPILPTVAKQFARFLNENTQVKAALKAEHIEGTYSFEDNVKKFKLVIHPGINKSLLPVTMSEKRTIRKNTEHNDTISIVYKGWIVLSPNDSLFFILKNITEKDNMLFLPMATSNLDYYGSNPLTHIISMGLPYADQFSEEELLSNTECLLVKWGASHIDHVIRFERMK